MVSVAVLRMGYAEVVFIQPGGRDEVLGKKLPDIKARCGRYKWSLQQDGAPSHTARNTETLSVRTWSSLRQTFFLPNSPDLSTVYLPSGVIFSRRSTIIKVSSQLTKWRQRLSKACMNLTHGAVIAISSLLSPVYLRLILFARWRHYFSSLIQINYGMMFRMKRSWFVPNLVKICSIFLKL